MAVTIYKPQNTKDDTFLIRIANEDNETRLDNSSLPVTGRRKRSARRSQDGN